MLLRHSTYYGLARGAPGIINFLTIAVYTRLLEPEIYGQYTLVVTGVGLFNSVFFQWLRLGLLRFFPAYLEDSRQLLSSLFFGYLSVVAVTGVLGFLAYVFWPDPGWRGLIALGMTLLWVQAWYELNLELVRSQLSPLRYGVISTIKSGLALVIGSALVFYGFKAYGPLIGLLVAMLLALIICSHEWRHVRKGMIDQALFHSMLNYGLPLTATFALMFIINSSDRFIIGWLLGTDSAGLYAAGYDLAYFAIGVIMLVINLAAYPLAVRALEQRGEVGARKQLGHNLLLLLAVSLPSATGLAVLAPNIADIILGKSYRETATALMPIIAFASLIAGLRSYHLDLAFQFSRKTIKQLWIALVAALVNIVLNLWWIPVIGLPGAAYATLVAFIVAFSLSWGFGQHVFQLPVLPVDAYKIFLGSTTMAIGLWFTLSIDGGLILLVGQVALGITIYAGVLFVLDFVGLRRKLTKWVIS